MALDNKYFDSINLELVKRKFYSAEKVNAVLDDIKRQAWKLNEEKALLAQQLELLTKRRDEIDSNIASSRLIYTSIVEKANEEAEEILAEVREERDRIALENAKHQDYAVKCMEQCISRLRERQLETVDLINMEWQSFLCGLEDAHTEGKDNGRICCIPEKASTAEESADITFGNPEEEGEETLFSDLSEKLDGIRSQIASINQKE